MSLAQALGGLRDTFGVSDAALGALPTAMVIAGVAGAIPIGIIADRVSRTRLLAVVVIGWTVCMLASGSVSTFAVIVVTQLGAGVLQATDPAALSLVGDYSPVAVRGKAMSVYQGGQAVGGVLGTFGAGFAVGAASWRGAFWMWVPLGVVLVGALWLLPEPERGRHDTDHDPDDPTDLLAAVVTDLPAPRRRPPTGQVSELEAAREILRTPTLWIAVTAIALAQLLLIAISFWGIEFFKREYGMGPLAAGAAGSGLGAGAVAGIVAGGFIADRRLRRGSVLARVDVAAVGAVGAGVVLAAGFAAPWLPATLALFTLGGFLLTLPIAPSEALIVDVLRPELRGRGTALRTILRALSGLGPVAVGALSDVVGLRWALAAIAPTYLLAGLVLLLARRTYPADLAYVLAAGSAGRRPADRT